MAGIEQGNGASSTVSVNINPYSILGNGVKTVPTAGTAVQLSTSVSIKTVTIRAYSTNTGIIYVGDSSVTSANGFQLSPQETVSLDIANLSTIWLNASANNDGVSYIYLA